MILSVRDKRSSLLQRDMNYYGKEFYSTGPHQLINISLWLLLLIFCENVIKLFFFVADGMAKFAGAFALGKLFQARFRSSTYVDSSRTQILG
jgi:hypothetical protein